MKHPPTTVADRSDVRAEVFTRQRPVWDWRIVDGRTYATLARGWRPWRRWAAWRARRELARLEPIVVAWRLRQAPTASPVDRSVAAHEAIRRRRAGDTSAADQIQAKRRDDERVLREFVQRRR